MDESVGREPLSDGVGTGVGREVSHLVRFAFLILDAHPAGAVRDVINLFSAAMEMLLRGGARLQARFREALVANGGVSMREQFPNFRTVFGNEWRCGIQVGYVHALQSSDPFVN